ncbi:MAG: phosphoribosylaminoimidazolesuccinocarboxamide synthase [Armatimonadetes bacterium]|nr:phosphoribosylaminoimidazolesuccinocarboxamide synthase [Armatimonadota bacterium]
MAALLHTHIDGLPAPKQGKVREVYDLGSELLIIATDRISAFDVIMANGIPDKGVVLNQMSAFWFEKLGHLCPTQVISVDDDVIAGRIGQKLPELRGRSLLARKAEPFPIECVARGYISGSLLKDYQKFGGNVHGLNLPPGLIQSSQLPEPIFTPATKAEEGHDENLSFDEAANLVGKETAEKLREVTLAIFSEAQKHAQSVGLILADTKFEFGLVDGEIIWIDEALTPDSSRYWVADSYEPGKPQPSFDKQFVRDYLETLNWDKRPPGPELPAEIVAKTREKYLEAFRRVTGHELLVAG